MAHIMLGQPKTLKIASLNIKKTKAQNIRRGDCQSNWFIQKNTKESFTPTPEKSKSKIGAGQNVKH